MEFLLRAAYKGLFGLNMVILGTIANRVKFKNIFEVYSLSSATFVFWSKLNSGSFLLVKGLFGLNRVKLGYPGPDDF